jgi:hypothetical protein
VRDRILTPANVACAVERARKIASRDLGDARQEPRPEDAARLEAIEEAIERAARLAVKSGGLEAATRSIRELEAERDQLHRRSARVAARDFDREAIEARVREMGAAFRASPESARQAFEALLDGRMACAPADGLRIGSKAWLSA